MPAFVIEKQGQIDVVSFHGEMFQPQLVDDLRAAVSQVLEGSASPRLVIDAGRLKFASSVFLGAIMEMSLKVSRRNGRLHLCCVAPQLQDLFNMMRLDKVVALYPSRAEAIASFAQAP